MLVTVGFGKLTASLDVEDGVSVEELKQRIEPLFDAPAAHQKLLFKGKELKNGTHLNAATLPSKIKIMLLCRSITPNKSSTSTEQSTNMQMKPSARGLDDSGAPNAADNFQNCDETVNNFQNCCHNSKNCCQNSENAQQFSENGAAVRMEQRADEGKAVKKQLLVDENQVLVLVVRGKEQMEFAMEKSCTVEDVKKRVAECTGVGVHLQRLLCRGKYPSNEIVIDSLKVRECVKFMLLFSEQQHLNMEVARSTLEMQADYRSCLQQLKALESKVGRNFFDKTEMMLRIAHLKDQVEILESNVQIAMDTTKSSALVELSIATADLLDQILEMASTITERND